MTQLLRRRRGLTEEAASAAADQACRSLRLPSIRALVPGMVPTAEKEQLSYYGFLASNESFSGWTKTFTDPRLCAAILDRLTFGGNIIETGTDSYRLAHTKNRQATAS